MSKEDKPVINIPAGNSPISEETGGTPDAPLSGDWKRDYKTAFSRIKFFDDLTHIGQVPCARSSLLYGIMTGTGLGAIRFIGSRKVMSACNWAVGVFVLVSGASWEICRSQRAKELAQMRAIQDRFPHRHISNLKRRGEEWTPPPQDAETTQNAPAPTSASSSPTTRI